MSELFEITPDATPLDADGRRGLIPTWISNRADLNRAEQVNILAGRNWALKRKAAPLDTLFLKQLHLRMLGDVWKWAGAYRANELNIGVLPHLVATELHHFLGDAQFWIANKSYMPDEIAVRYHHRMVWIHPFTNGNGRHSRLATDLLCKTLNIEAFSWGRESLDSDGATRRRYIEALRSADRHDIEPLLAFVRS